MIMSQHNQACQQHCYFRNLSPPNRLKIEKHHLHAFQVQCPYYSIQKLLHFVHLSNFNMGNWLVRTTPPLVATRNAQTSYIVWKMLIQAEKKTLIKDQRKGQVKTLPVFRSFFSSQTPTSRVIPGTPNNGTPLWEASHTIPISLGILMGVVWE